MARIRSDSFTLSSSASRMTVLPRAKQAARASAGISSMARGTKSPAISVASSWLDSATKSATGSPSSSRTFSSLTLAPMALRTSRDPALVGLIPTPGNLISALG